MSNFYGQPSLSAGADRHNVRVRFRLGTFLKGTCWTFRAGRQCGECQYEHTCFKCNAKLITQVNVRSHQPTSAPTSENQDHNLLIQVLHSLLVTPIKAARFENLVAGPHNPFSWRALERLFEFFTSANNLVLNLLICNVHFIVLTLF